MAKGGVTITELALRAGVSAATVSIVLNRKPLARRVPEHTQLRIRELAEQLSYRPSHFAPGDEEALDRNLRLCLR